MNDALKRFVAFLLLDVFLLTLPLNLALAEDTEKSDLEKALDSWTYAHYTILSLANNNGSGEEDELFFRQNGLIPLDGYGHFGEGNYGYTTQEDQLQVVFMTNDNAVKEIQLLLNRDLGVNDEKKYYLYDMFRRHIMGLIGLWSVSSLEDYGDAVSTLNGEAFATIWANAMISSQDMSDGPLPLGKIGQVTSFYLTSSKTIGMSLEFFNRVDQNFISIYAPIVTAAFSSNK